MGKYNNRSRDQKRKAKLKKEIERTNRHESLAYHGQKYKNAQYVGIMLSTETGIYETFVLSDGLLTDDEVERALESLIVQMRQGPLPPFESSDPGGTTIAGAAGLVLWNIRRRWHAYEQNQEMLSRDDLIGVLRTILGSLQTWRSQSMHVQGYLRFLEGFLKKAGVTSKLIRPGELPS